MKKLMILAAALLMVGSAFAAPALNAGRLFVQPNATFLSGSPATTNNDSSCDIAVTPAATLLLPYFEVDYKSPSNSAVNTLFALTNTSSIPQIVHITLWTDWSFPVLDFNIFLTGYDVQTINLYDIISRGVIPVTGLNESNFGPASADTNPNWVTGLAGSGVCNSLPGPIPSTLLGAIQTALTTGVYAGCSGKVGGTHDNAIGYLTADTAGTCTQALPTDPGYYTDAITWDNVLIGDYFRINPTSTTGNFAGGNPMVHIRAIPEGGQAGTAAAATPTNFPYTFYDRYTPGLNPTADRRQPLPSMFAARYIDRSTASDNLNFGTRLVLWREGDVPGGTTLDCGAGNDYQGVNSGLAITEIVRFDESENPSVSSGCQISPCPITPGTSSPETSAPSVASDQFPAMPSGSDDAGGWMYLNLSNPDGTIGNNRDLGAEYTSQNWVVIEMTAEGRYGVDYDAAYLGNGCTPNPGAFGDAGVIAGNIGPAADVTPTP